MVGDTTTSLEGWSPTSSPIDIKALSPKQTSINRPCTGSEHHQTDGQHRQENVNPSVLSPRSIERYRNPDFVEGNGGSPYWRPQTGQQKETAYRPNQLF